MPASRRLFLIIFLLLVAACAHRPPPGLVAAQPFDIHRYAGKWYEIARLDNVFERGLSDIHATYSLNPDGTVTVSNRGYDGKRGEWREARGEARYTGDPRQGSLQVSFFPPFSGGYHVVALDETGYRWALVAGDDRSWFWILARDQRLPPDLAKILVQRAAAMGFDTRRLIWVSHTRPDA